MSRKSGARLHDLLNKWSKRFGNGGAMRGTLGMRCKRQIRIGVKSSLTEQWREESSSEKTWHTVFNVEQIDGLPAHYYAQPANPLPVSERIAQAEQFIAATAATIHHGGNQAYYAPARDLIQLPPFEAFRDRESYYATALHELTHWTRHPSRLERDFGRQRFGDQRRPPEVADGYAREELVAELGASFLSAALDITPEIRDDHAAYLGHWLTVLKSDKRAIFQAAAHAQRAADYLHGLQTPDGESPPPHRRLELSRPPAQ